MEKKYTCHVGMDEAGYTVKQILVHKWSLGTGQIKKAKFRKNGIMVNGKQVTVRYVLQENDLLEVLLEDKTQASSHLIPMQGSIQVLYEDDDLLVVEKPAGIVCHPSAGHYCDSMANLMVGYFAEKGEGYIVRLAGRLDKGTSGLLLYAKNAPALTELERQRIDGRMQKFYYAILTGIPEKKRSIIEANIGPDEEIPMKQKVCSEAEGGAYALTQYEVLWTSPDYSLAEVTIATGRTHQIRTHMSWFGHPLIGDVLYGGEALLDRPALHAHKLIFQHPSTGNVIEITSQLPQDMQEFLKEHGLNGRIKK